MLEVYNSNAEYQKLLNHIGSNLAESWSFGDLQTVYDSRVIDMMRHNKIHKHMLYNDIAWYIIQHSDRDIANQKKISNMYFLIEVNGEIYENGLEDDLQEILSIQGYGGSAGKKRITKKYWEAIEYIREDLKQNPLDI